MHIVDYLHDANFDKNLGLLIYLNTTSLVSQSPRNIVFKIVQRMSYLVQKIIGEGIDFALFLTKLCPINVCCVSLDSLQMPVVGACN